MQTISYAGPSIKFCLQENCKTPEVINISDKTWLMVKEIFNTPFQSDKDEQDNICGSITLIENDIYSKLTMPKPEITPANTLYVSNSINNHYRNSKYIIALLLDKLLITRHYFRNTIKVQSWGQKRSTGLLLQSLSTSKKYILELKMDNINASPTIYLHAKEQIKRNILNKHEAKTIENNFE